MLASVFLNLMCTLPALWSIGVLLGRACQYMKPQEISEFFGTPAHRKHHCSTSEGTSNSAAAPSSNAATSSEPTSSNRPFVQQLSEPSSYCAPYTQTLIQRKRSIGSRLGRIDSECESPPYSTDEVPPTTPEPGVEEMSERVGMSAARFSSVRSMSFDAGDSSLLAMSENWRPGRSSSVSPRERDRERFSPSPLSFASGSGLQNHQQHRLSTRDLSYGQCDRCGWPIGAETGPMRRISNFDTGSHAGSTMSLFMSGLEDECTLHVPQRSNPTTDDERGFQSSQEK